MAKPNTFEIEITEDGLVKIITGKVSQAIHAKAEEALKRLQAELGGEVKIEHLPHAHADTGVHTHGGAGQQHSH